MGIKSVITIVAALTVSLQAAAQLSLVRDNGQHSFAQTVPAGNYSGIAHIGGNRYAVVDDKAASDGFHLMEIDIDSVSGDIMNVTHKGFVSSGLPNRDEEGIAMRQADSTLWISGEDGNKVLQYRLDGSPTGRMLNLPPEFIAHNGNYGLESIAYNDSTHTFWTTTESTLPTDATNGIANRLRLQAVNDSLQPCGQWTYVMDKPHSTKQARNYAMGVSELLALDDGSLLVLEREFYVPKSKIGAWCQIKIYQVWPTDANMTAPLDKHLVYRFSTRLTVFNHGIANYEGMCLGPRLTDGSQCIILVSDSQGQYGGVLRDWFKTIVVK